MKRRKPYSKIPTSTRFCTPICICFVHETSDIINAEISYTENQINMSNKTEIPTEAGALKIQHTVLLTTVDEKVCNAATGTTSTMRLTSKV